MPTDNSTEKSRKLNKERECIVDYLKKQIDKHIEFDSVPENDDGWHEVKRENVYKILDGLIPLLKKYNKNSLIK